jgi:hypothetical protein
MRRMSGGKNEDVPARKRETAKFAIGEKTSGRVGVVLVFGQTTCANEGTGLSPFDLADAVGDDGDTGVCQTVAAEGTEDGGTEVVV